jgi:hypothetical protein
MEMLELIKIALACNLEKNIFIEDQTVLMMNRINSSIADPRTGLFWVRIVLSLLSCLPKLDHFQCHSVSGEQTVKQTMIWKRGKMIK